MQHFKTNENVGLSQMPKLVKNLPIETIFIKIPDIETIKHELRNNANYFYSLRLTETSKWLSELLLSVTELNEIDNVFYKKYIHENTDRNYSSTKKVDRRDSNDTIDDKLLVIKNLFDLREFKKAAFFAYKNYQKENLDNEILFYYSYSIYMHEKLKIEEEKLNTKVNRGSKNPQISKDLETIYEVLNYHLKKDELSDANLYIYSLILKERALNDDALEILVKILNKNPFFWSAWCELSQILSHQEKIDSLQVLVKIDNHWMKNFFSLNILLENVRTHEKYENYCYDICCGLLAFFSNSSYLLNLLAVLFHNISDYESSLDFFNKIFFLDPFRSENLDILSNILYVKENQNDLGKLSLNCFENNKYCPETCCVLGNYYSLIGDHTKAAIYFKRAISLDRNFLAAYTLLGHEYLELKNIASAIEAYNDAVQINSKDFRAWYGLGQAYELQNHLEFALYYFLQALKANPRDSRMWNAVGNCYKKMEKHNVASKCLEKAESLKDQEGISLFQLGKMYDILNLHKKAVQCFEDNLAKKDQNTGIDKETSETLLYLAYYYKNMGEFDKAMLYSSRLLDYNGFEQQEAQMIIQSINMAK